MWCGRQWLQLAVPSLLAAAEREELSNGQAKMSRAPLQGRHGLQPAPGCLHTGKVCWCASVRSAWLTVRKSSSSSLAITESGVPAWRAACCALQARGGWWVRGLVLRAEMQHACH